MNERLYLILQAVFAAAMIAFFIVTFCACSTQQIVPATVQQDSTTVQREVSIDTLWRDRWHTEYTKGDTVFIRDSVERFVYRYRTRVDSVIVRDSIPYKVEVVKEVRKRNFYDKFTARGFWCAVGVLFLWLLYRFLIWYKNKRF